MPQMSAQTAPVVLLCLLFIGLLAGCLSMIVPAIRIDLNRMVYRPEKDPGPDLSREDVLSPS